MKCAKCGKSVDNPNGGSCCGMRLKIEVSSDNPSDEEFAKQQLGKYASLIGEDICFCLECVIDAMFQYRYGSIIPGL